ncbi:ryanodine receptor 2-like [Salvelinus namaycush]|uniref:Ryanodine receptor 2-like n=1 Tax=Salvelinus namaycush TaxID=8040 RepID=A0A8U0U2L6_SALNM|nr:ryanodine receptor 2-like [Salvelinus namaycush]
MQESAFWKKIIAYQRKLLNYFARNFYNMRMLALFVAFAINFILLFYKVITTCSSVRWDPVTEGSDTQEPQNPQQEPVFVHFVLEESTGYMEPTLRILAILHTVISFCCIIGYYCLKVPLVIFKREKEVARKLEFDGLYITEQPSEDDIKGQWDRLVINTGSFPNNYWDKFVKRKVMDKYGEFYGHDRISELLGMDKAALDFSDAHEKKKPKKDSSLAAVLNSVDVKYQIWKLGVVFTDNSFLYLAWYMTMSILGHYNNFFFAAHLLDIAMGFKTLRTILSSVTHNGKQLVLTVGLLAVVVYLYTVVAFNFFRKFYNRGEEGETPDMKCDDMLTCYMFHMYVGVRAGGGIGDQIEDPAGDEYEIYRIIFDITFFFFVIVILLAIIQGLIIDAFGELRDQQEQVKEDMETKCFICGIGNDYFDTVPHGFETHTLQEHNLANYLVCQRHTSPLSSPVSVQSLSETYVPPLSSPGSVQSLSETYVPPVISSQCPESVRDIRPPSVISSQCPESVRDIRPPCLLQSVSRVWQRHTSPLSSPVSVQSLAETYVPPVISISVQSLSETYVPPVISSLSETYVPPVISSLSETYVPPVISSLSETYVPPVFSSQCPESESYVWKMYQERCWEFFPAGDCFRKQYEDQLN